MSKEYVWRLQDEARRAVAMADARAIVSDLDLIARGIEKPNLSSCPEATSDEVSRNGAMAIQAILRQLMCELEELND